MDKNELEEKRYTAKFVSPEVVQLLNEFKTKMDKLDEIQSSLAQDTANIKNNWEGSASESVLTEIDKFQRVFEDISIQNEKYVKALNTIIDNYAYEEKTNKDTVDQNVDSFDFTRREGV